MCKLFGDCGVSEVYLVRRLRYADHVSGKRSCSFDVFVFDPGNTKRVSTPGRTQDTTAIPPRFQPYAAVGSVEELCALFNITRPKYDPEVYHLLCITKSHEGVCTVSPWNVG